MMTYVAVGKVSRIQNIGRTWGGWLASCCSRFTLYDVSRYPLDMTLRVGLDDLEKGRTFPMLENEPWLLSAADRCSVTTPTEPSLLTPNQQVSQIRMPVELRRMRNLLPLCMEGIRQMFSCRARCNPNLPLQPPTQTTIWAYSEFARGLSLPHRSSVYRDRARLRPGIS